MKFKDLSGDERVLMETLALQLLSEQNTDRQLKEISDELNSRRF